MKLFERKQWEVPAVDTEIVSAESHRSQGACRIPMPVPMKCLVQVQAAQEVLLSGVGQSHVNKALKLCCVMMTQGIPHNSTLMLVATSRD